MAKLLIINADDFGLEEEVNRGIIEAHRRGVVTSASLIPTGSAFGHAIELARDNPRLDVGAHLTLTRGPSLVGMPVLPPTQVPSLVKGDGLLPQNPVSLAGRIVLGLVSLTQIRLELTAQLEKIHSTGIRITHIDSHQHIHLVPAVFRLVTGLAQQFGVTWLRLPLKCQFSRGRPTAAGIMQRLKVASLRGTAAIDSPRLTEAGLRCADYYVGVEFSGRLSDVEMENLVTNVPDGITELSCHPGVDDVRLSQNHPWGYRWERELAALCSAGMVATINRSGVQLVRYSEISV
ncbi:MAG: ChbG/HpnK family deacetylase [Candidatus Abyssobacteria bacterium SURF_17]|uniref:ChbG/HpnK family deacetylase n=1 Tax=Candidatus Abyssobacteria bacterium SURF_17 TaxID=2093361 RepID=A0A419F0K4_9BACT|nr:MAG: ChbG/HpnK family deacetylase [Candidatus Abyssubacteria bacterium SURF_17]